MPFAETWHLGCYLPIPPFTWIKILVFRISRCSYQPAFALITHRPSCFPESRTNHCWYLSRLGTIFYWNVTKGIATCVPFVSSECIACLSYSQMMWHFLAKTTITNKQKSRFSGSLWISWQMYQWDSPHCSLNKVSFWFLSDNSTPS